MDTIQIERFKGLLESRLGELSGEVRNRDTIAVEKTADAMDEAQLAEQRDLAIRILDHDFAEIRLVQQALIRIEEGTYGHCLRCDKPIGWKRLSVSPHAAFCIPCQEKADEERDFSFPKGLAGSLAE